MDGLCLFPPAADDRWNWSPLYFITHVSVGSLTDGLCLFPLAADNRPCHSPQVCQSCRRAGKVPAAGRPGEHWEKPARADCASGGVGQPGDPWRKKHTHEDCVSWSRMTRSSWRGVPPCHPPPTCWTEDCCQHDVWMLSILLRKWSSVWMSSIRRTKLSSVWMSSIRRTKWSRLSTIPSLPAVSEPNKDFWWRPFPFLQWADWINEHFSDSCSPTHPPQAVKLRLCMVVGWNWSWSGSDTHFQVLHAIFCGRVQAPVLQWYINQGQGWVG